MVQISGREVLLAQAGTRLLCRPVLRVPAGIEHVPQSQVGVPEGHAGAGVAHHGSYLLAHVGSIAVHAAAGTRRLVLSEGAALNALLRVPKQGDAVRAEPRLGCCGGGLGGGARVMVLAVHGDHHLNGALLSLDALVTRPACVRERPLLQDPIPPFAPAVAVSG